MAREKCLKLSCQRNLSVFFDKVEDILGIAQKCGTAVFVIPEDLEVKIKNAIILQPEEKSVIAVEQVRQVQRRLLTKQTAEQYVVVRPAEKMNEEAANAFLKSLEEPGDRVHFVLVTSQPSSLLPTILSRAKIYWLRENWAVDAKILASDQDKTLAKKLIAAKPADLVAIAEEITKKKDKARKYALEILGIAIEMLYKTYLINGKEVFLKKVPKFLRAYENISRNGHIKLHLVADLC